MPPIEAARSIFPRRFCNDYLLRQSHYVHFCAFLRNESPALRVLLRSQLGEKNVVDKQYLVRQALTLLKYGKATSDPNVAAALFEKAAELQSQLEEAPLVSDLSPRAPDVQAGK